MSSGAVPLRKVEIDVLPEATPAELVFGARGWAQIAPEVGPVEPAGWPMRIAGPKAGEGPQRWGGLPTRLCRVGEVYWAPRFGTLITDDGRVWRPTIGAPWNDPRRLAQAPGLSRGGEGFLFAPPAEAIEHDGASVFLPWGAGFNYGHFVIDALPSLLALEAGGLTRGLPPAAPRLRPWQRALIGYLGLGPVREMRAPVLRLREAAFADSMDHFLHTPNALVCEVRSRILERAPAANGAGTRRIYFSRRGFALTMRVMLNEAAVERALRRRGFRIVHPERLSPDRQIALMRNAEVIVGASGAAMANALFAPAGALVVDIQPELFASTWVQAIGQLVGQESYAYRVAAPAPETDVPWRHRMRRGFRWAYETPLNDVLPWLDRWL